MPKDFIRLSGATAPRTRSDFLAGINEYDYIKASCLNPEPQKSSSTTNRYKQGSKVNKVSYEIDKVLDVKEGNKEDDQISTDHKEHKINEVNASSSMSKPPPN